MIAVLAALLSGAMFYLSQGFDDVWVLAWFAPVPLLWLAYGKQPMWQVMAASAAATPGTTGARTLVYSEPGPTMTASAPAIASSTAAGTAGSAGE